MMTDMHNNIKVERSISPVNETGNSALVGQVHDLANCTGFEWIIALGSLADSDATYTVLIEDSDSSFSGANVDDAYLLGTEAGASFTFAADNGVRKIGYIGPKRYVRMTITPASNTGDSYISALGVKFGTRNYPHSDQD